MPLQMHRLHPRIVFFPQLHKARCGWIALVVYADGAVAKAGHEQMAYVGVARQRRGTRVYVCRHIRYTKLAMSVP